MTSHPSSPTPPNIVLTGFMGVGKSTVGREVAARLGRPFIDLDDLIEQNAGMSISDIFETQGEAHFRALEMMTLRELAAQRGMIIATGGGALVDAANREMMTRSSLVICLTASVSAIEARVGDAAHRPLLAGVDKQQRIVALMNERAAAYAEIPYWIDTSHRTIAQVADEVIALAESGLGGVLRLPVKLPDGSGYDILLGAGLLTEAPALLAERGLSGDVVLVSDENVAPHWSAPLLDAFARAGVQATLVTLPAGESHKTLDSISRLYDEFLSAELDRSGVVIALGGGVIGDMAGFAAATYLRGVRFVQMPTSLLAMVDSSVGGKTGVDLPQGKNLVGAFKQPELVIIDPDLLATLPPEEFRNGLGEVIKHGIIEDTRLFAQLEGDGPASLESMIARALRVKIGVVQRDPFEGGERAHLNLGHTFGHAIERVSGYAIPHGQAVGLGLIAAARLAAARGLCAPDIPVRIREVVGRVGLPTQLSGYDPAAIVAAMTTDKKRKAGRVRFVLPRAIGDVGVYDDVSEAEALAAVASLTQD